MSHVIVVGLGQVGFRVARLLNRLGERVVVVTDAARRQEFQQILSEAGVEIIFGDARNASLFRNAQPEKAKAILCCTSIDLVNIEVALDARKLSPKARIIVRMFDQDLAKRLLEPLGLNHSLGMSVLSAPAFCLSAAGLEAFGSFDFGKDAFAVIAPSKGLTGQEIDGGREIIVSASQLREKLGFSKPKRGKLWSEVSQLWTAPWAIFRNAPGPLKVTAGIIIGLSLLSIFVFQRGMGLSPVDATYFVVTTLTTTGYGDISVKDHGTWLTIYACFLMLLGSAAVATLYSFITDFIISSRFDQMLGRRWVKHEQHVIVVGLGSVGYRTVLECRELGIPVVAVDIDSTPKFRVRLGELDFVAGDGRDQTTLQRAGIEQALAVIACTDDDAVNLGIGLTVKELNPKSRTVLRLFDANFAQKAESSLPVDETLSASRIAAPGFVGAALFDSWLMSYVSGNTLRVVCKPSAVAGDFEIREMKIKPLDEEF